jgi:AcrR family transcriptional regulator
MRQTTRRRKRLFLETLRRTLGVAPAADAAGVSRATVYRWRSEDPDFASAWDSAVEAALDDLEKALHERAKTKDTLAAIAILRNRRRNIYNDSVANNQVNVQVLNAPALPLPGQSQADVEPLAQALLVLLGSGATTSPPAEKVIEVDVVTVEPPKLTNGTEQSALAASPKEEQQVRRVI